MANADAVDVVIVDVYLACVQFGVQLACFFYRVSMALCVCVFAVFLLSLKLYLLRTSFILVIRF